MYITITTLALLTNILLIIKTSKIRVEYTSSRVIALLIINLSWTTTNLLAVVNYDRNIIYLNTVFFAIYTINVVLSGIEMYNKKKSSIKNIIIYSIVPTLFIIASVVFFISGSEIDKKYANIRSGIFSLFLLYSAVIAIIYFFYLTKAVYRIHSNKIIRYSYVFIFTIVSTFIVYSLSTISNTPFINRQLPAFLAFFSIVPIHIFSQYTLYSSREKVINTIVDDLLDIIIAIDNNGFVVFMNIKARELFKIDSILKLGLNVNNKNKFVKYLGEETYNLISNNDCDTVLEINEIKYKKLDKQILDDDKILITLESFVDISNELNHIEKINKISVTDSLTSLKNRFAFDSDLLSLDESSPDKLAVIVLDLDNLKVTNDIFGHVAGDSLIIAFSRLLKNAFSDVNSDIYRFGGDEFCVFVYDLDENETKKKIENLFIDVSKHNEKHIYSLYFSVGCAYKVQNETITNIYKAADLSMIVSKENGKNKVTYYSKEIEDKVNCNNKLKNELKDAIINNELIIYLQPKLNLTTNKFDSAEALARWNHKEIGIITPDKFINLAVDINLIYELDMKILETTLKTLNKWKQKYNKDFIISTNLSFDSLLHKELVVDVKQLIDKYNIKTENIIFEIIENNVLFDFDGIKNNIEKLKELGVKFAIDDFGRGSSNLEVVNGFNADYIKLDKSLIDKITTKNEKLQINNLTLICELLKSYDCEIVAEGVETIDQAEILKKLNIEFLQGYYYSIPVSTDDFEDKYLK